MFIALARTPLRVVALDDGGAVPVTPTGTKQRYRRWRTDTVKAASMWEWCA